uniref:Uncharacterized protein n=1 Tax=Anguilla anguilla TaxID=7936 RepID=A0A0E9T4J0_ANGAN
MVLEPSTFQNLRFTLIHLRSEINNYFA